MKQKLQKFCVKIVINLPAFLLLLADLKLYT